MKKLLGIIVLGLLLSGNAYANISSFEKWLYDNGHYELVEKIEKEICKSLDKGDPKYNTNLCHLNFFKKNLDIKVNQKKYNLAYQANPNLDTLIYYLWKYSYKDRSHLKEFRSTNNSYDFKFNLIEDKYLKKQMKTKGILSYLYYQDDQVLIDEFSPKGRLGEFLNNETKFYSMSMGKSVTSYILGHAICEGYIDGVDARIDDWPIIENTLYYNQKLINFLNMNTGDQKYINEFTHDHGKFLGNSKYVFEEKSISMSANRFLKGSVKSKNTYNYNGFVTQLIINYIKFKTGDDYDKLYSKIFNDKVKIQHSILYGETSRREENGNGHQNISATRFDYLRIAKAIMDDYQNDTCVGKYLKEIYKRRIPKNLTEERTEPGFNRSKTYGGQFHFDYPGLKDKIIFGMNGYGGQAILIDMENSRIVVLNSLHYNNTKYKYGYKKLLFDPIKNGK